MRHDFPKGKKKNCLKIRTVRSQLYYVTLDKTSHTSESHLHNERFELDERFSNLWEQNSFYYTKISLNLNIQILKCILCGITMRESLRHHKLNVFLNELLTSTLNIFSPSPISIRGITIHPIAQARS